MSKRIITTIVAVVALSAITVAAVAAVYASAEETFTVVAADLEGDLDLTIDRLDGDGDIEVGEWVRYNVRLQNPDEFNAVSDPVWVEFDFSADEFDDVGVDLQYYDGSDWQDLDLNGDGYGYFGPEDGFTVDARYDETTTTRIRFRDEVEDGTATLRVVDQSGRADSDG